MELQTNLFNEYTQSDEDQIDISILNVKSFKENNPRQTNFYVTLNEDSRNEVMYNKIGDSESHVYYYLNETTLFKTESGTMSFNLHRLKHACYYIFKTNDGRYGVVNFPAEMIDISFPKFIDFKRQKAVKEDYASYNVGGQRINYEMTTYTNIGFIKDLVEILYIETNYKTIRRY